MKMLTIGLTGGSGAGKGFVAELFAEYGIASLDTDRVSRLVCEPGKPCTAEIAEAFGASLLNDRGELDRRGLAAIVFADPQKLAVLNAITHKYILEECRRWLDAQRRAGARAAIIDAPQLFESGFDRECDLTVAVIADRETRMTRIVRRDGITPEAAAQRLSRQHGEVWFASHCTFTVSNRLHEDPDRAVRTLCRVFGTLPPD